MKQQDFAFKAAEALKRNTVVTGLAVEGSWLTGELDEFSDLNLLLATSEDLSDDVERKLAIAGSLGDLIASFAEGSRYLLCLFQHPLLQVGIRFVVTGEHCVFSFRPSVIFDRTGEFGQWIANAGTACGECDYQWMEDRFWLWVHDVLLKVGRGEFMEAADRLAVPRGQILGPLLHVRNCRPPRGVRMAEACFCREDREALRKMVPSCDRKSLMAALRHMITFYRELRLSLFGRDVCLNVEAEQAVMAFSDKVGEL